MRSYEHNLEVAEGESGLLAISDTMSNTQLAVTELVIFVECSGETQYVERYAMSELAKQLKPISPTETTKQIADRINAGHQRYFCPRTLWPSRLKNKIKEIFTKNKAV